MATMNFQAIANILFVTISKTRKRIKKKMSKKKHIKVARNLQEKVLEEKDEKRRWKVL
jgi:large-conductance mechanosensitive channel